MKGLWIKDVKLMAAQKYFGYEFLRVVFFDFGKSSSFLYVQLKVGFCTVKGGIIPH